MSMYVNVLDHGADPMGTLDSTVAISAAVDALDPENCRLDIPAGTYLVNDMITIRDRTNLVIDARGAQFKLTNATPSVAGAKAVLDIRGCTGFTLSGLRVSLYGDQAYSGVNVANSTFGLIHKVQVECWGPSTGWVGITVFDPTPCTSKNIVISGCAVTNTRFGISTNGQDVRITECHVGMPGLPTSSGYYDGIMVLKDSDRTIVSNCFMVNCGAAGVFTEVCTNVVVDSNIVSGCLARGIEIAGKGVTVVGNMVRNCHGNINLIGVRDVTVTGNRVENSDPTHNVTCIAVNVGSSHVIATANHVRQAHPSKPAIWVDSSASNVKLGPNGISAAVPYGAPAGTVII